MIEKEKKEQPVIELVVDYRSLKLRFALRCVSFFEAHPTITHIADKCCVATKTIYNAVIGQ